MADSERITASKIGLSLGSVGAALLILANVIDGTDSRSVFESLAVGTPLASAPFVALLAGSWSRVRVAVEPAGLSRSRRILSPVPALLVLAAIVGSAVLLGSGDALFGLGTLAATSVAFARFLSEQIAARPPTSPERHEERDIYDLRRTPGVAGLGAITSLFALIAGASTESLWEALLWASFPLAITLLAVYGAAAPYLALRGTPSAIVFCLAAPTTLVSAVVSDDPSTSLIVINGAALLMTIVATRALERTRRAALASVTSASPTGTREYPPR